MLRRFAKHFRGTDVVWRAATPVAACKIIQCLVSCRGSSVRGKLSEQQPFLRSGNPS